MKHNIKWHQSCLDALTATTKLRADALEQAKAEYHACLSQRAVLATQIQEAIKAGKEEFDAQKYLIKK